MIVFNTGRAKLAAGLSSDWRHEMVEVAPTFTFVPTLRGEYASLESLAREHAAELGEASKDGELWQLWYTTVPRPEEMAGEIERRLSLQAAGSMLPFTVRCLPSNEIVGMTTFMNIDAKNRHVEIGSTWYARRVQRSALNTECKLMLLTHAFEKLDCIAVEFRTHIANRQSRAGIERLGAKLDGILRNHIIMPNGTLRDTCVYSIIASEWPVVKAHLEWQLSMPRP
jgi:RimJ/RimL family protein N-acetyltransferase